MEAAFSIQQVSRQTGLSIDTLRYYERIGLIEPIRRAPNTHRRYTQEDVNWIHLLIRLKETSMPLTQMVHFARLRRQGPCTLAERRIMLEQHQHALEQQIGQLEQHRVVLQQKIATYKEREAQFAQPSLSFDTTTSQEK